MRTVKIDGDHVANYERSGKRFYKFEVRHEATGRPVRAGTCRLEGAGLSNEAIDDEVAQAARSAVKSANSERLLKSAQYALGQHVPGAPPQAKLPPVQRAQIAEGGGLEIAATMPVMMIRNAYKKPTLNVEHAELTVEQIRERRALEVGREILIGATDEQILKIARGQATLTGTLRTGIKYQEAS